MKKQKAVRKPSSATKSRNTQQRNTKAEEAIAATPPFRRAKTIAGIASTLGLAWIAIRATKQWWGSSDED